MGHFVVQFLKHQGETFYSSFNDGAKIAYRKTMDGRSIKASTIPIRDDIFGIVGLICINVDVSQISKLDTAQQIHFFEDLCKIWQKTPDFQKIGEESKKPITAS